MIITEDIKALVDIAIREDLGEIEGNKTGFIGDITTQSTINLDDIITTSMVSRDSGVICGVDVAVYVFNKIAPSISIETHLQDGAPVKPKDRIITLHGNAQEILQAERIALNFMTHLSGISTQTARFVAAVKHTKAKVLDTRKTLPGWRVLQKHAVKMGGGQNHRMGLYDMVLIKDNHIAAAGGIIHALDRAQKANPSVKIEIEVDTIDQLKDVISHGTADIVLLDNMPPDVLKQAVCLCDGQIKTEASGGITLESVVAVAESGVDYISSGSLTHSVTVFDIGLDAA